MIVNLILNCRWFKLNYMNWWVIRQLIKSFQPSLLDMIQWQLKCLMGLDNMKPYVNFTEFEKNKKVQKAWAMLQVVLFPKLCSAYTKNKRANLVSLQLGYLNWNQWERAIVAGVGLKGKDAALFIGHSRRWGGTSLI